MATERTGLWELVARRLPDRKRLVDAAKQVQDTTKLLMAERQANRLLKNDLGVKALRIQELEECLLGERTQAANRAAQPIPSPFGTSQVPESVVVIIPVTWPAGLGDTGTLDVVLNFLSDGELKPGIPNPNVTIIGHGGLQATKPTVKPTWREPDDDEPLGVLVPWPVMVEVAGVLTALKGDVGLVVNAPMAQAAADILAKLDRRAFDAAHGGQG